MLIQPHRTSCPALRLSLERLPHACSLTSLSAVVSCALCPSQDWTTFYILVTSVDICWTNNIWDFLKSTVVFSRQQNFLEFVVFSLLESTAGFSSVKQNTIPYFCHPPKFVFPKCDMTSDRNEHLCLRLALMGSFCLRLQFPICPWWAKWKQTLTLIVTDSSAK